jgi:7-cyano-7-deazaguanine synthase
LVRNEALRAIGGSALTDNNIAVPDSRDIGHEIPVTYVPFRNAHFLSVAVSWAEVIGASKILIGAVEQDSSGYPDCRPTYYEAFNRVIAAGTKQAASRFSRLSSPCARLKSSGSALNWEHPWI